MATDRDTGQVGKYTKKNSVSPYEPPPPPTTGGACQPTGNGTSFKEADEAIWLRHMEKQFRAIADKDGRIYPDEFKKALNVKDSFFADRFFALFDADKSGYLTLEELTGGLTHVANGSQQDKLRFLFDVYDIDGSGNISRDEIKEVLGSCMAESSLEVSAEDLDELATVLFESADKDNNGSVCFEELMDVFNKFPDSAGTLTVSAINWLKPPVAKKNRKKARWTQYKYHIQNNLKLVLFLAFYFLVNIGLFVVNVVRYHDNNGYVIVARGAGMVLNFNGAFVVVLMLRYTLTWLRMTPLKHVLPFDHSVMLHKLVGYVICIFTVIHTVCHLANIALDINATNESGVNGTSLAYWEYLFTLRFNIGWIGPGFAYLSGVILDIILVIMFICSMSFVRRSGHFQVFYWSHILYIIFLATLILHGPIFWYFFILPGSIFAIEKIYNSIPFRALRYGQFYITEVNLLPSRVTHLVISRPENFYFQPGDYVFIHIPQLASNEWHPFTISSAPEIKGLFWLHIRAVGNWTNRLHEFFQKYKLQSVHAMEAGDRPSASPTDRKQSVSGIMRQGKHKKVRVRCYINGPYGTPTREIMDSEHVVLIGSGIGVTPFASILQSMAYRHRATRVDCPKCQHIWYPDVPEELLNVKKVDFLWINRDQRCFEWFVSLLTQLEVQEAEDGIFDSFLNMQLYMTAAASRNDMKGIGLQMALDLLHEQRGTDLITGLKTQTRPGRPDWQEVFNKINADKKGRVMVFFCGPPLLGKMLRKHCDKFKFDFHTESF